MNMIGYIRRQKHIKYVEEYVTEMRNRVVSRACLYGNTDVIERDLYLKYNEYLKELRKKS